MKNPVCRIAVYVLCAMALQVSAKEPSGLNRYVNPFIGTDGTGHTSPGASVPFGMVYPGPDTNDRGWDHTSGYQYKDTTVMGFSNTRISGAGIPELGDVLLQPKAGVHWNLDTKDFRAPLAKTSEKAMPGYYRVRLPTHGVTVELTATQRVAFQRYTFNKGGMAQVLVDLQHGLLFEHDQSNGDSRVIRSDVQLESNAPEISGTVHSRNWVEREASFVLRFDQPILRAEQLPARGLEKAPRYLLTFKLPPTRQLEAQVALSTVDVAGARGNLHDIKGLTFDKARRQAAAQWNDLLGRIHIEAPLRQKTIFYTALYHTFLHPSDIADADGRVRGPTGHVIQAQGGRYYSTLSLWDTFRGVHPLFTILVPERVNGFVTTLLDHHKAMGYLPLWTAWGRETWTMIGNPALPVIADAVVKGFQGFSREEALRAMVETSQNARPQAPVWAQRDWTAYLEHGFIPFDKISNEAVSKTLELGVGDDAVARVAQVLGNTDVRDTFRKRSQGYRQLFDPETRMMRGRDSKGNWRTPFDPLTPTSPMNNPGDYTEANAWQYTLTPALHDPEGLVQLMGGPAAFEQWLDQFFTVAAPGDNKHLGQEALIGQYAHGNEPSHHIAYLYAYTPSPWKGPARIAEIMRRFYTDKPGGITGNDDCGQMSAWYVLSTLGFYPVVPASGSFVMSVPQASKIRLTLPNRATLHISGPHPQLVNRSSPQSYRALLNGREVSATGLRYADLMAGGHLRVITQTTP